MNKHWTPNQYVDDDQRRALALKWIRSLERLRNKSSGKVRSALSSGPLYYINEYSNLAVPVSNEDGNWGLRRWPIPVDGFYIAPLVDSDAELHPFFAERLKNPSYWEGLRTIFLPSYTISSVWRALILFHETGHTFYHRANIYRDIGMGYWMEEYEIYIKEIEIVRKIYGRPYTRFTYKLSRDYEAQLRSGHVQFEMGRDVSYKTLIQLFGKPQSKFEANVQRSVVIMDAVYKALDRIHTDNNKREHYDITRWFHEHTKTTPA